MIIKKYEGATENEAIMKAKEELGGGAIIMNIKTTRPRGIFRMFRKTVVEVTAAIEDRVTASAGTEETREEKVQKAAKVIEDTLRKQKQVQEKEQKSAPSAIEKKLDDLADMLEKQMVSEKKEEAEEEKKEGADEVENANSRNKKIRDLLYNQFIANEVKEEYAHMLVEDVENIPEKEEALDAILAKVYQRIVLKLGQPMGIELKNQKKPRVCFFVGSTGVGKTTTIAKIASIFKLEKKAKVALITSDTYRIAAVEQLKTYANILSVPIRVVYSAAEMKKTLNDYASYDLILVDTAGRSHKNKKQCDELSELLNSVDAESREVYLVLSATTKYKDLKQVVAIYKDMADYRIVFTKLDETSCYGNLLNVRMDTGAPLSYVTCGQVVPDDLGMLNAQTIAKQLLGGCE